VFDESSSGEPLSPVGERGTPKTRGERRTPTARVVVGVILLVILVAFVVDNRRTTRIGYVFGHANTPLFVMLLVTALIGAAIGWLVAVVRQRRHSP
jgi:uncharacterized integral membrane protein